jgi:hypothetical protein
MIMNPLIEETCRNVMDVYPITSVGSF